MSFFSVLDSAGKILWVSGVDDGMQLTREQMQGNRCVTFIKDAVPWSERCGQAILLGKTVAFRCTMTDHSTTREYKVNVEPIREPGHAQLIAIASPLIEHDLTENEVQIAKLVAQDLTQKEIAERLGLTVSTVGSYCTKIRKKRARNCWDHAFRNQRWIVGWGRRLAGRNIRIPTGVARDRQRKHPPGLRPIEPSQQAITQAARDSETSENFGQIPTGLATPAYNTNVARQIKAVNETLCRHTASPCHRWRYNAKRPTSNDGGLLYIPTVAGFRYRQTSCGGWI